MVYTKINTLFIGSGIFAQIVLDKLLDFELLNIIGVITQPDKIAGRKKEFKPCRVKELLMRVNFRGKVFQPESLKIQAEEILIELKPDLIIVTDYGQMISENMIDFPKYKCINIHGSLLPDLRGAVPIPISILKGYKSTGVSIPIMTKGLDDGPVIVKQKVEISPSDTAESLKKRMALIGANLIIKNIADWVNGKLKTNEQEHKNATYCYMKDISKDKAEISINTPIQLAERMIRAFYPWPIAWMRIENPKYEIRNSKKSLRLKIYNAGIFEMKKQIENIGKIIRLDKKLLLILKDGKLELIEIQLEGKKRAKAREYFYLAEA